ncbi:MULTISPECIES: hypothetical protein [Thalassospira]|uniref:Uncharacterized protein n=2 Tax=Thalassospira TaxID=168934 RepID=A0A367W2I8_9PROT|nr:MULTISPECIES: hypothetical protein [Thalassospira]MDG4718475.1 hypothetical protein [Thalassospira sp. FZY0004]RCK34614.1 hypothetical protein TH19_15340 [Thalassospira profundimaris]
MSPVLAIYGKEHILGYIRGTLEDDEEKHEIESLVKSDPRAARIVCDLQMTDISDHWALDAPARHRLERLQAIADRAGILA